MSKLIYFFNPNPEPNAKIETDVCALRGYSFH
jgi:hypothetical protein